MSAATRRAHLNRLGETIHRAFVEFLTLPLLIVGGFLLLAALAALLDRSDAGWLEPARALLRDHLFRDGQATSDFLATIAGSLITVTSITFSLLLLAVQQAASSLSHHVYDQFLRRWDNQIYFGFFVGLALYTLLILASVAPPHNPVFGAALALLLTIVALTLMILLLYTTINQMRPEVVIEAIHDHVLLARQHQRSWLRKTQRADRRTEVGGVTVPVRATTHGYLVRLDVDALVAAGATIEDGAVEVVLRVSLGTFVAFGDTLADIRAPTSQAADDLARVVQNALAIEEQRDLDTDPVHGIEQLSVIAWTSISTAKSNPSPGLLVLRTLRDLMARWSADADEQETALQNPAENRMRVVYSDDVFSQLFDAFETLAVVASESMQSQTVSEIMRTFAVLFDRLPAGAQRRAEDLIRRSLSALGEHVLTAELNAALGELTDTLEAAGRDETAARVEAARRKLAASVGALGSRATRVSGGPR